METLHARVNAEIADFPEGVKGRPLSVSDVIVVYQDGKETAYYCDSFGFTSVPEFLTPENYLKTADMAM